MQRGGGYMASIVKLCGLQAYLLLEDRVGQPLEFGLHFRLRSSGRRVIRVVLV
jgi:hypothetical protein